MKTRRTKKMWDQRLKVGVVIYVGQIPTDTSDLTTQAILEKLIQIFSII